MPRRLNILPFHRLSKTRALLCDSLPPPPLAVFVYNIITIHHQHRVSLRAME